MDVCLACLDEFLDEPVEIGGESALISTIVLLPKQTLSLALGMVSPMIEPPEVVSSLWVAVGLGKAPECLGWPASVGLWPLLSLETLSVKSSMLDDSDGDG